MNAGADTNLRHILKGLRSLRGCVGPCLRIIIVAHEKDYAPAFS
jgi:hypothetical protein